MALFWEQGYEATSMQDLVDAMEIGRGSLYETFGSKEQLFERALSRYVDRGLSAMIACVENAADPLEGVRSLLRGAVQGRSDSSCCGCFMVNTAVEMTQRSPEVAEVLRSSWSRLEKTIVAALVRAQESGQLSADKKPRALARFVVTTIHGLAVQSKYVRGRSHLSDVVEVAVSALQ